MDLYHLKNSELEPQFPKYKRSSCAPRWHCERRFWFVCSIHWKRIISITNDGCKSLRCHLQTAWMRRTSSCRSIRLHTSQNGRCTNVCEESKIGVQTFGYVYTAQMAKIMVQYGRPSRSSWAESVGSSFGKTIMRKAIWQHPFEVRLRGGFQLGMLIRIPWTRIILICVCGWHQAGRQNWKHRTDLENSHERLYSGRTTMFIWVALKESVKLARILWRTANPGFLLEPRTNHRPDLQVKPDKNNICLVPWCGGSCE